jgi:predicted metal-dependent peptidase
MAVLPLYFIAIPLRRSFAAAIGKKVISEKRRMLHVNGGRSNSLPTVVGAVSGSASTVTEVLEQLQTRQILRINNADRLSVIINNDQVVDPMAFKQVENFHGQFVLVHANRIQRH